MAIVVTDFRCYLRGRRPEDWTERWRSTETRVEGAACDLAHRNSLRLVAPASANGRAALSFNAADGGTGHANQQLLILFREPLHDCPLAVLRGSGAATTEGGYVFSTQLGVSATQAIGKYVAGTYTQLGTFLATLQPGAWYWLRFEATSTSVRARVWPDGTTEPGTWGATVTDSAHADGWLAVAAFYAGLGPTWVKHFGVGLNGDSAPGESALPLPMDKWSQLPDLEAELTVEFRCADPTTGVESPVWVSNLGRSGGDERDYPARTPMEGRLVDAGSLSWGVTGDKQFGGAALSSAPKPIVVDNSAVAPGVAGPYDNWRDKVFSGHQVVVRAGLARFGGEGNKSGTLPRNPHRNFEVVYTALAEREPDLSVEDAKLQVVTPSKVLKQTVPVVRNVGIQHCFQNLAVAGSLAAAPHAAYAVKSFTIMLRVWVPAAGASGASYVVLSNRYQLSNSRLQWEVLLFQASWATPASDAHRVWVRAHADDGSTLFSSNFQGTSPQLNTDTWHTVIAGLSDKDRWYLLVDGVRVAGASGLTKSVNLGDSGVSMLASGNSLWTCDQRIEAFLPEEEALARFATMLVPDSKTYAMWRCNDNSGTTATDYSPNANHAVAQGVQNTNWQWGPSYLGSDGIAGTPQPMSGGILFHAPTQAIDPTRELFRHADRAITAGALINVRAKGLVLGTPAAYGTPYAGTIDIVGASDQPITFGQDEDLVPGTNRSTQVPQLVQEDLAARGSITPITADYESFLALRQLLPMIGGYYFGTPPTVEQVLQALYEMGAHCRLDPSGRVAVGAMAPSCLYPGPYWPYWPATAFADGGFHTDAYQYPTPVLEFMGYPRRGVTFSNNAGHALTNTAGKFTVLCWFCLPYGLSPDNSGSSSVDYSCDGWTLIDCMSGTTNGYWLGFEADTGALRFATGGIANTSGGLHYSKVGSAAYWVPGRWYAVSAGVDTGLSPPIRMLVVSHIDYGQAFAVNAKAHDFINNTSQVTGTLSVNTGGPLRIGHGPKGAFPGAIAYCIGCSPGTGLGFNDALMWQRVSQDSISGKLASDGATQRWRVDMLEGEGDLVRDSILGIDGRIEGARWAPRLVADLRKRATPEGGVRRAQPAWRVNARYRHNYQTLNGGDVAAGVSAAEKVALQQEWLEQQAPSLANLSASPLALDVVLDTPLFRSEDAKFIASMMAARFAQGRQLGDVNNWPRSAMRLLAGDEVQLYHPKHLPNGLAMRLYALAGLLSQAKFSFGACG